MCGGQKNKRERTGEGGRENERERDGEIEEGRKESKKEKVMLILCLSLIYNPGFSKSVLTLYTTLKCHRVIFSMVSFNANLILFYHHRFSF